ncbi:MAG: hypothetical protein LBF38_09455 [Deltaproteobacteria bacterium]|jgi:hypothetical protein|nr:hypothetical protein [Deltaproteobacteria bacterium]
MPGTETLFLAFVGGIFGASLGALWAFCLCGLVTLFGCGLILAGGSDFLLLQVGLGPIFGPHAGGFLAGVVASSYASGFRGNHPGGPQAGKDILSPLIGTSWDVLVVGGLASLVSVLLVPIVGAIPLINQGDHLAITILIVTFISRFFFQKESPFGNAPTRKKYGLLGTNNHEISWLPWMAPMPRLIVLGFGVGGLSGGVAKFCLAAIATGNLTAAGAPTVPIIFCWGLSAMMLTCLQLGQGNVAKVPCTHCMALVAALGFVYTNSLFVAAICGALGALIQELAARLFYNHAHDHLDPPAAGIAISSLLLSFVFKPEWLNLSALF